MFSNSARGSSNPNDFPFKPGPWFFRVPLVKMKNCITVGIVDPQDEQKEKQQDATLQQTQHYQESSEIVPSFLVPDPQREEEDDNDRKFFTLRVFWWASASYQTFELA